MIVRVVVLLVVDYYSFCFDVVSGAKTIIAFLDFKKVLDMVPTLALLEKVRQMGRGGG